ncbi:putative sphingolipid long chain base-responsive protein [Daldinia sp. FL1419]|nr:putative sphingolipid long chain base-responsive protein [Daldinia sp. FL1419]
MNRSLSIRSNKGGPVGQPTPTRRKGFSFASLRGSIQPELSRRLYQLIKSTNNLVSAHETAGRERETIAKQLSEWGEQTGDDAVSDISDKVGVVLSELGAQEETYAHGLDEARGILKFIRNTEKSVQPSRDAKAKIADEIQRLKLKEPQSSRLVILEQELVRAEAENLVAEAQLTNITRSKLKEAYDAEFAAVIERAEKQIILAKHGRRLLELLDDSPVTPGDARHSYENGAAARQVLNDAEDDLKSWERNADSYGSVVGGDDMTGVGLAVSDGNTGTSIARRGGGETPVMTGAGRVSANGGGVRYQEAGEAPHVSPTPTSTDEEHDERGV